MIKITQVSVRQTDRQTYSKMQLMLNLLLFLPTPSPNFHFAGKKVTYADAIRVDPAITVASFMVSTKKYTTCQEVLRLLPDGFSIYFPKLNVSKVQIFFHSNIPYFK